MARNDDHESREVRIHALSPTPEGGCILLLEEVGGSRILPIVCGMAEGQAIAMKASGIEPLRPMTHDLLASTIEALGGTVERVVVTEVKNDTFYARVLVRRRAEKLSIDARPSDALNLAIRCDAPIFVTEHVFSQTECVLKPISGDEVERFKQELESADPAALFRELEGKPAPGED
jgi:bifunctional DNase/RNase